MNQCKKPTFNFVSSKKLRLNERIIHGIFLRLSLLGVLSLSPTTSCLNRKLEGSVCGIGTAAAGGGRNRHYARKGNLRKNAAFYALLEQFRTTEKKRGLLAKNRYWR